MFLTEIAVYWVILSSIAAFMVIVLVLVAAML